MGVQGVELLLLQFCVCICNTYDTYSLNLISFFFQEYYSQMSYSMNEHPTKPLDAFGVHV